MARMNGKGPESHGDETGRGLGRCRQTPEAETNGELGKGMGLRRKAGGGKGKGKRLKSGLQSVQKNK